MTKLLYQKDSYIQEFQGMITRIDSENNAMILDQTAFYPGGGGQPAPWRADRLAAPAQGF